jgi:hypothetical protein
MDSIEADVDGLSALGALCIREAEALTADRPTSQAGPVFQATTGAVDAALAMADRAATLIGLRLRVTGHAIVSAADRLATSDTTSCELIAAVGDTVVAT